MTQFLNWLFIFFFSILTGLLFTNQVDVYFVLTLVASHVLASLLYLLSIGSPFFQKHKEKLIALLIVLAGILGFVIPPFLTILPLLFFHLQKKGSFIFFAVFPILAYLIKDYYQGLAFLALLSCYSHFSSKHLKKLEEIQNSYLQNIDSSESTLRKLRNKNMLLQKESEVEKRNVVLQERNRIAREIHDNVGHQLTSAILQLSALEMYSKDQKELAQLKETLQKAMEDIRISIHAEHRDSLSVKDMIHQLVDSYQFAPVQLNISYKDEVPANYYYNMKLIIKECLANTAKHSNASKVNLVFKQESNFYLLLYYDNGTIINENKGEGIGLLSMEERTQSLGGSFHYNLSDGFHLFIQLPIQGNRKTN